MRVKNVGCELPINLLELFELKGGIVHWVAERPAGYNRRKLAPWGGIAGGREVWRRGKIVAAGGHYLLTCDIAYALQHAGEWPWQHGAIVPEDWCDMTRGQIDRFAKLARERWHLDNGRVFWRQTRGDRAQAGDEATGFELSGFRCKVITTGGMCYLVDDVKTLLASS